MICVDNLFTGKKHNISHLMDCSTFEFLHHDITSPLFVDVDEIYHLACPASPIHYQQNPIQTTKTSINGAINILDLAKRINAKVFFASTSEIYGNPLVHPQPETYFGNVNPIGPRSCYDEGKRCAESLFFNYHRKYGIRIKVARIFNTYGPNMQPNDGRVVSNFIIQSLQHNDVTIYGTGNQTRTFCYADDLIDGIVQCMDSKDQFTGPINLGGVNEITIMELWNYVKELTNSKSQILYKPLPTNDPVMRKPDISLAEKVLRWKPKILLKHGLQNTIYYFSKLISASKLSENDSHNIQYQKKMIDGET